MRGRLRTTTWRLPTALAVVGTILAATLTLATAPPAHAATVPLSVSCGNWIDEEQRFPIVDVTVERGDTLAVNFADDCLDPTEEEADARTGLAIADTYFSDYPGKGTSTPYDFYLEHFGSGATVNWVVADDAPWGQMPWVSSVDESYPLICTNCGRGVSIRLTVGTTPSAPGTPTATPGAGSATVSWTPPATAGSAPIASYLVTAAPGGATCTATAPSTSCVVEGLTPGTSYTFTVVATSEVGTGEVSAASAAVTIPSAPTTTTAPPGSPTTTSTAPGAAPGAAVAVTTSPRFTG